jgi:anaerobic magnesium-protoporphyrin IX monomethyl ester cyclase
MTTRVTLIRPPAVETIRLATTSITPPLGLAYIAGSILKSGRTVDVLDAVTLAPTTLRSYFKGYLIGLDIKELVDRISPSTSFIGITAIFTHEWPMITELIRLTRQMFPEIPIIVGGEHVTSMPSFCAATSEAEYFVCGEGEETILDLLDALESQDEDLNARLSAINGLVFKSKDRQLVVNPRRTRNTKLDDIALPAWQHLN